jgi:hypothetical protein
MNRRLDAPFIRQSCNVKMIRERFPALCWGDQPRGDREDMAHHIIRCFTHTD